MSVMTLRIKAYFNNALESSNRYITLNLIKVLFEIQVYHLLLTFIRAFIVEINYKYYLSANCSCYKYVGCR